MRCACRFCLISAVIVAVAFAFVATFIARKQHARRQKYRSSKTVNDVMKRLFSALEMTFGFNFDANE